MSEKFPKRVWIDSGTLSRGEYPLAKFGSGRCIGDEEYLSLAESESQLSALRRENERLRAIVRGYKTVGTDGCRTCETGRVTLFVWNERCTECDPAGYDTKADLARLSPEAGMGEK